MKLLRLIAIFLFICVTISVALKCRSDDGALDADLKRIVRTCMRRISETNGRYNQNLSGNTDSDYDEYNRDDRFRQRNRGILQMGTGRSKRSSNDRKYDPTSNGGRNQHQNQRSNGNNHHSSMSGNNNNNSSYGDRQYRDMQGEQDAACVVHCFFEELNMLNNDDYPDKHKVNYILTKDIRDREVRVFFTDSIQECFHYLEMQRRKDKCQFSKELINCMTEYYRANCDDWQEPNLIFS